MPTCKECGQSKSPSHMMRSSGHRSKDAGRCKECYKFETVCKRNDIIQAKRAAALGLFVEKVDRRFVAERDQWLCGICGGKVERADVSVDHIIPMSLGGLHAYDNAQLAHKICNIRKGGPKSTPTHAAVVTSR